MKATSGMVVGLVFSTVLIQALNAVGQPARSVAGISASWIGQDGQDFTGPHLHTKPDGVQDVHIRLTGLPTSRAIASMKIRSEAGDEWFYNMPGWPNVPIVRRDRTGRTADVFFEPSMEGKARAFVVQLKFDDGTTAEVALRGRAHQPNLRMPAAKLAASWVGQDRQDWVGLGPGVGPDGIQDLHLALRGLSPDVVVQSMSVEGPGGVRWESGVNPKGYSLAELIRDPKDPSRADLYIEADRDLAGKTLTIAVAYEHGKTDRATLVGASFDPKRKMPRMVLPALAAIRVKAEWLGQDGSQATGPGDVHLALSGLPSGRPVAGAVLSNAVRGSWVYRRDDRVNVPMAEPESAPLVLRAGSDPTRADLFFAPIRDEAGTTLTLRLVFTDGSMTVAQFPGGTCDPAKRAPAPAANSVKARPGDDLNELANRFGTVTLTKGKYPLSRPLVLEHPVILQGEPGATLVFTQKASDRPWTTAIKIHRGGTKLGGFAVRFTRPVRWNREVSWGPAIIGLTDNLDGRPDELKWGLEFSRLDIESPPAADAKGSEEAPRLLRLAGAPAAGKIVGNVFRGGTIECFGGPWLIADNDYRGTPPGIFSYGLLAIHEPHDVTIRRNTLRSVGPSGKSWRFLVLVGRGYGDRIEDNTVVGIGPRDEDKLPPMTAPEVIVTESYHLRFEGAPAAVSADGRVVGIPRVYGEPVRAGDVVSVLAGPNAGQWRRVAQAITPTIFLLESPLPARAEVISISPGFVGMVFQGNMIDSRGGRGAGNLCLIGNHFGTRVINNRLLGAHDSFLLTAYPSESPVTWGWSHVPFLGGLVEGNTLEDAQVGGVLGVHRNEYSRTSRGRVYLTMTVRNNTVRWSEAFLADRARRGEKGLPPGITIGFPAPLDAAEQVVTVSGNRLEAPAGVRAPGALWVRAASLNGRTIVGQSFELSAAPAASVSRKDAPTPRGSR